MSSGRIITVKAENLRKGDIFSTDSMQVTEVQLGRETVYVEGVCHGYGKSATLARGTDCHLWQVLSADTAPMELSEARHIAGLWHNGQSSALYGLSSSGRVRKNEALAECADILRETDTQTNCADVIRLIGWLNTVGAELEAERR